MIISFTEKRVFSLITYRDFRVFSWRSPNLLSYSGYKQSLYEFIFFSKSVHLSATVTSDRKQA